VRSRLYYFIFYVFLESMQHLWGYNVRTKCLKVRVNLQHPSSLITTVFPALASFKSSPQKTKFNVRLPIHPKSIRQPPLPELMPWLSSVTSHSSHWLDTFLQEETVKINKTIASILKAEIFLSSIVFMI
jgi:hypothetical protein